MSASAIVKARLSAFNMVDPRFIDRAPGFNPRTDFGDIEALAASIKVEGVQQPLTLKRKADGRLELVDGDRRLTAIELLLSQGETFDEGIPAKLVDKDQDDVTGLIQMFVANTGKPFNPLEEATAFKKMRDAGMSLEQIAMSVGRNHVHVNNTLALLEAPESLREAVASGQVGLTVAKNIATAARGDTEKLADLTRQAVEAGGDKTKVAKVKEATEAARQERAEKEGRTLKVKPLTAEKLDELGKKMAAQLQEALASAGISDDRALMAEVSGDNKLAAVFTLGVVMALKKAAGLKVSLAV